MVCFSLCVFRYLLHVFSHDLEFYGPDAGRAVHPVGFGYWLLPVVPTQTLPIFC